MRVYCAYKCAFRVGYSFVVSRIRIPNALDLDLALVGRTTGGTARAFEELVAALAYFRTPWTTPVDGFMVLKADLGVEVEIVAGGKVDRRVRLNYVSRQPFRS